MFALEITFKDGVSQPEMIFIRRPQAIIGASDYAHVVVEDLKALNTQLRLVRDLGRKFRCKPLGGEGSSIELSSLLEGTYEGEATLDLGPVKIHFTSLDIDLILRESEPPDRAGVRVLRQACAAPPPLFPAVVVGGSNPMVVSFVPDQPIYIGRAKQCALRLDSSDISAKHARLGYEGGEFWIEDLGSTNGTFLNQQQISGRVNIPPGTPIALGREVTVMGITSDDQIERAHHSPSEPPKRDAPARKYPVLISVSEVARPARLVLTPGASVTIGRDPSSELWLGAPHVSRRHCKFAMNPSGLITVTDSSTNGTAHDSGVLRKGDSLEIVKDPKVFDFGGGITVGICFDEEQERRYVGVMGAADAFRPQEGSSAQIEPEPQDRVESGVVPNATKAGGVKDFMRFFSSLKKSGKIFVVVTLLALTSVLGLIGYIVLGIVQKI